MYISYPPKSARVIFSLYLSHASVEFFNAVQEKNILALIYIPSMQQKFEMKTIELLWNHYPLYDIISWGTGCCIRI